MSGTTDPWSDDLKKPENVPIVDFLRQLPEDEVFALVRTTSAGLAATTSLEEAISIILHFSDGVSLLNRKRVKKEYLAKYLLSRKVKFSPISDKSCLCNLVLKEWGQGTVESLQFSNAACQASPHSTPFSNQTNVTLRTDIAQNNNEEVSLCSPTGREQMEFYSNHAEQAQQRQTLMQAGLQLSYEFATWFYTRLNSLEDFLPGHFWPDCNFSMQLETGGTTRHFNVLRDGNLVHESFRRLIIEERCGFNPNTLQGIGICGKINPHGLAQVAVCGTIHRGTTVCGIFEQTFGLIKDPTENNTFKIKFTMLRVKETSAIAAGGVMAAIAPSLSTDIIEELTGDE